MSNFLLDYKFFQDFGDKDIENNNNKKNRE